MLFLDSVERPLTIHFNTCSYPMRWRTISAQLQMLQREVILSPGKFVLTFLSHFFYGLKQNGEPGPLLGAPGNTLYPTFLPDIRPTVGFCYRGVSEKKSQPCLPFEISWNLHHFQSIFQDRSSKNMYRNQNNPEIQTTHKCHHIRLIN